MLSSSNKFAYIRIRTAVQVDIGNERELLKMTAKIILSPKICDFINRVLHSFLARVFYQVLSLEMLPHVTPVPHTFIYLLYHSLIIQMLMNAECQTMGVNRFVETLPEVIYAHVRKASSWAMMAKRAVVSMPQSFYFIFYVLESKCLLVFLPFRPSVWSFKDGVNAVSITSVYVQLWINNFR